MRRSRGKNSKSVYIAFAMGCPRTEMDTAWLFPYFRANGWRVVDQPEKADLAVAAACGVEATARDESLRRLTLLKERLHGIPLIVTGCLAGIDPARVINDLEATPISPADLGELDRLTSATVPLAKVPPINDTTPLIYPATRYWRFHERYWEAGTCEKLKCQAKQYVRLWLRRLRVESAALRLLRRWRRLKGQESIFRIRAVRGCLDECTYCAIRLASGTFRSKLLEDILAEFDRGLREGYRLFELIGEDLGPYGSDIGTTLPTLLEGLFRRPGAFQVTFTDVNVRYVIQYATELAPILAANSHRIERLRVPVQSGSDRLLKLMRRGYVSADVKRCLMQVLDAAPSLPLETHVLVGFPGETDDDFQATIDLLRTIPFVRIQVYKYADRPGTASSQMDHKVPDAVKEKRVQYVMREFPHSIYCSARFESIES